MISSGQKVAGFFSLKANSQRFNNKNFTNLGGKPLYSWAAELLEQLSGVSEKYVLCNSDLSLELGKTIKRLDKPLFLDGDSVGSNEIISFFSKEVQADWYLYLHATAPFISAKTVGDLMRAVVDEGLDSGLTVKREQTFAYYMGKPVNFDPSNLQRTQDMSPVYLENSGAYFFSRELAQKGLRAGETPLLYELVWPETIDVDHISDYQEAILALPAVPRGR